MDQWHQPVDSCRVSAHIHLGMTFRYQQPVEADVEVEVSANEYFVTFMHPNKESLMVGLQQNPWVICCTGGSNLPWCRGAKFFPFFWVFDGD